MKAPSRFLPSIASLRALEALDRLGSASAVAKELSQTQSAVSRQLQALEAQLGVNLILRKAKRMQMTPEARMYTAQVRQALQTISRFTGFDPDPARRLLEPGHSPNFWDALACPEAG